jgi:hypothetical protein
MMKISVGQGRTNPNAVIAIARITFFGFRLCLGVNISPSLCQSREGSGVASIRVFDVRLYARVWYDVALGAMGHWFHARWAADRGA